MIEVLWWALACYGLFVLGGEIGEWWEARRARREKAYYAELRERTRLDK